MKKKEQPTLTLFCLTDSTFPGEWLSIQGDKYKDALSFPWKMVNQFQDADVIIWDGLISPKASLVMEEIIEHLKKGKMLLLERQAETLHQHFPFVKILSLDQIRYIEVSGRNILPEELLLALEACYQKCHHV